ncbi:MAG: DUF3179 domain-containing protein [Proteobacteria bacterium]|nr:DUF3179 domain-containing protein [Pseudomonadota bacterium]
MQSKAKLRQRIFRAVSLLVFLFLSHSAVAQQASLIGNVINLPVVAVGTDAYQVELTLVEASSPIEVEVTSGVLLSGADTTGASIFDGTTLAIPSIDVDGIAYWANFSLLTTEPPTFVFIDAGVVGTDPPQSCVRPDPDPSHGTDNPQIIAGWAVPPSQVQDGGPGIDGIPAIGNPVFTQNFGSQAISDSTLVVGVKIGDEVRAYSHTVLDLHEVVNDQFIIDGQLEPVTINYCPLTGSAMLWKGKMTSVDPSFGVSGLLYNSNLIMYDRETTSYWSQMLEQGITNVERLTVPDRLQVIETTWGTWKAMYPQTSLLTTDTGFSFPYGFYPYGSYKTNNSLLFNVNNSGDGRLHRKERVLGINVGTSSKVYPVSAFGADVTIINDTVGDMNVVAAGSSLQNFAAIFNRQLEDCTTLEFSAIQGQLPIVMTDNEGNEWDIFGSAVSGPRAGTQLQKTNSYIAFWFAWTAFFTNVAIHQ